MFEKGVNKLTSKNFSLGRLKSLIEVNKAGYILNAAKGNTTEAAKISRQIGELEEFFGKVSLRSKNGRLKGLSKEGKELAVIAENFLVTMQAFQDKIDGIQPSIAIGAGETFLSSVLLPNFADLRESSQGIRINLCNMRSSNLPEALDSGKADLIIASDKRLVKKERKLSLGNLSYKLYVPLTWHNLSRYKEEPLELICNEPYASLSGTGQRKSFVESETIKKTGKRPNYELECSSHLEVLQAIKSKCFCGIIPSFIGAELGLKDFKQISIPELINIHGKLVIAWKKETFHFKPEIENIAKEIQKVFKKITTKKN